MKPLKSVKAVTPMYLQLYFFEDRGITEEFAKAYIIFVNLDANPRLCRPCCCSLIEDGSLRKLDFLRKDRFSFHFKIFQSQLPNVLPLQLFSSNTLAHTF